MYPLPLQELIQHFESLSEGERRDGLIDLAEAAAHHAPKAGETFDFEQVRKDAECSDAVGIHLRRGTGEKLHLAISMGPEVQTLTRAMAALLCRGLEGSTKEQVLQVPEDFVPRVVGAELVRTRSRTVYYILRRIKEAAARL